MTSIGDAIVFASSLWFVTWFLSKVWPSRFGGSIEDYLATKLGELARKQAAFIKAQHDEMQRRRVEPLAPLDLHGPDKRHPPRNKGS